jgi:valyl-tRNA synthetase
MANEYKNIGVIVAENEEQARELALQKFPQLADGNFVLRQDEDCLDTWFSSWLWPISVFDGINHPDNKEINYYYPTNDLVTGPDIIFFWVARMVMSGYEYRGEECFNNVYFTGIVRDKLGRKMSKQLGNSPDPIELINKFGADGVRMGMMLAAPAGNDILFDEALCEQGRNFCNKIWNAFRLIQGWEVSFAEPVNDTANLASDWFEEVLEKTIVETDELFDKYRLSEALMAFYKLFWDDFCAWYLEIIKPEFGQPIDKYTFAQVTRFFNILLKLLHPFMPFITEELWQELKTMRAEIVQKEIADTGRTDPRYAAALLAEANCQSIMVSALPKIVVNNVEPENPENYISDYEDDDEEFAIAKQIIAGIRSIRQQKNISPKDELALQIAGEHNELFDDVIMKLANLESIETVDEKSPSSVSFLVGTTEYSVPVEINVEEEIAKMQAEIVYLEGFIKSVQVKLSNEKFVSNAKPEIVEIERKKFADAESKINSLKEGINQLKMKNLKNE